MQTSWTGKGRGRRGRGREEQGRGEGTKREDVQGWCPAPALQGAYLVAARRQVPGFGRWHGCWGQSGAGAWGRSCGRGALPLPIGPWVHGSGSRSGGLHSLRHGPHLQTSVKKTLAWVTQGWQPQAVPPVPHPTTRCSQPSLNSFALSLSLSHSKFPVWGPRIPEMPSSRPFTSHTFLSTPVPQLCPSFAPRGCAHRSPRFSAGVVSIIPTRLITHPLGEYLGYARPVTPMNEG